MESRTIIGILIIMILESCVPPSSINKSPNPQEEKFNSGLIIENRINRGTSFTDSIGDNYNIRNIPITISNDTTLTIQIQIAFLKEYSYHFPNSSEKFKLIPLSKEWAMDGIGVTENMISELPRFIEKPQIKHNIEPGEKLILSIGSVYPNPAKLTGVLPRTLFVKNGIKEFSKCEWVQKNDRSSSQQFSLGLKIVMGEQCMLIPCGSISYLRKLKSPE